MSYCRLSPTSDVYIFGTGKQFECILAWKVAHFGQFNQHYAVPYSDNGDHLRTMIGHLYYLRNQGVKVPEHAIARMLRELEDHYDALYEAELQVEEEGAGEAG